MTDRHHEAIITLTEGDCEALLRKIYRMQALTFASHEFVREGPEEPLLPGITKEDGIISMIEMTAEILDSLSRDIDSRVYRARTPAKTETVECA
jgi:hypothetical protein